MKLHDVWLWTYHWILAFQLISECLSLRWMQMRLISTLKIKNIFWGSLDMLVKHLRIMKTDWASCIILYLRFLKHWKSNSLWSLILVEVLSVVVVIVVLIELLTKDTLMPWTTHTCTNSWHRLGDLRDKILSLLLLISLKARNHKVLAEAPTDDWPEISLVDSDDRATRYPLKFQLKETTYPDTL
jgi:hypothetical protein